MGIRAPGTDDGRGPVRALRRRPPPGPPASSPPATRTTSSRATTTGSSSRTARAGASASTTSGATRPSRWTWPRSTPRSWIASGAPWRTRPEERCRSSAARAWSAGEAHPPDPAAARRRRGRGSRRGGCSDQAPAGVRRDGRRPCAEHPPPGAAARAQVARALLRRRLAGQDPEPGRPAQAVAALRPRDPRVDARAAGAPGAAHRNALATLPQLAAHRRDALRTRLQPDLGLPAGDHRDDARPRRGHGLRERQPGAPDPALPRPAHHHGQPHAARHQRRAWSPTSWSSSTA